jgi:hypothetical protein
MLRETWLAFVELKTGIGEVKFRPESVIGGRAEAIADFFYGRSRPSAVHWSCMKLIKIKMEVKRRADTICSVATLLSGS